MVAGSSAQNVRSHGREFGTEVSEVWSEPMAEGTSGDSFLWRDCLWSCSIFYLKVLDSLMTSQDLRVKIARCDLSSENCSDGMSLKYRISSCYLAVARGTVPYLNPSPMMGDCP